MKTLLPVLLTTLMLAACLPPEQTPDGGEPELTRSDPFTAVTLNLYLGTDFSSVWEVSSSAEVPGAAAQAWSEIQATDFPSRAVALAAVVQAQDPMLIGLQEVELYRSQSPGDGWMGTPSETVELDFLEILKAELEALGGSYSVAAVITNTDFEVPMAAGAGAPDDDIRLTDREVILVRSDVEVIASQTGAFETIASINVPGLPWPYPRPKGWAYVDLRWQGYDFRFASTHLEIEAAPEVQVAQTDELIAELADSNLPTIMVGDFNSAADGSTTASRDHVIAAGYTDAWDVGAGAGFTCCQAGDLQGFPSSLGVRIDYVFTRGDLEIESAVTLGATNDTRTSSGLWPSDHAGVAATLRLVRESE